MPDDLVQTRAAPPNHDDLAARVDDLEAKVNRLLLSQALAAEAFRPSGPLTDP